MTSTNDSAETIDPRADSGLDGIGMSGSIVFEDGIEAQGNVRVQMCNSDTCCVKWSKLILLSRRYTSSQY